MTTPMSSEQEDVAKIAAGKAFHAETPIELMLAVYRHNGWPVALGRMVARFVEHYEMKTDPARNRYVATPRVRQHIQEGSKT